MSLSKMEWEWDIIRCDYEVVRRGAARGGYR